MNVRIKRKDKKKIMNCLKERKMILIRCIGGEIINIRFRNHTKKETNKI